MAIYVLIVETTLKAVPGLIMVVSTTAGSTVMVNIMAYVTGMSNPICHACHPFIFAFAHRDFKEVLYRSPVSDAAKILWIYQEYYVYSIPVTSLVQANSVDI
ncbi:unnamed protein product [Gongylonema pulchrum]|uniref:Amino acid transporter n=1 Tax=Gongylonema pulchrum TaxID=637853 RepID=A0A183EUB3_9BILA|nr:unnamed protein product [Gongylonema pulchrum]